MKLFYLLKPPCPKPVYSWEVEFVDSSCPNCKLNNYQKYDMLTKVKYMLRGFSK